jgi:hypothetical protein
VGRIRQQHQQQQQRQQLTYELLGETFLAEIYALTISTYFKRKTETIAGVDRRKGVLQLLQQEFFLLLNASLQDQCVLLFRSDRLELSFRKSV